MNTVHSIGVARQIGTYADATEAPAGARWLLTSGTPGIGTDGSVPADVSGQAELAWTHIVAMLERARMAITDIVKVNQYLTRADDIAAYGKVRAQFLGDHRAASLLLVTPALVRPDLLVEVEVYAAKS